MKRILKALMMTCLIILFTTIMSAIVIIPALYLGVWWIIALGFLAIFTMFYFDLKG